MNLSEIVAAARITKSAAQRFTHTLETLGYLRKDAHTRRWVLTPKMLDLGYAYLAADPLIEQASPHLLDLNQACGESVNLSEPDGTDMVFVARFPSHKRFFVHISVGRRLPMFCTAAGRAYLSALPDSRAEAIIAQSPIHRFTPLTETDRARIADLVRQARDDGYAWANEEYFRGDLNIAVPLLGVDGDPVGAINISGPTSRWTLDRLRQELVPLLIETARAVSARNRTELRAIPPDRGVAPSHITNPHGGNEQ